LTRSFLEAGDPASVERCVAIVEKLRKIVGGDIIDDATRALRPYRPGPASFRTRLIAPEIRTIPGLDVYVGALPRTDVSADFFEVIPVGEQLVIGIGDAPGAGLKSAFVARFLGNLLHRLVQEKSTIHVGEILSKLNSTIGGSQYFERISMQCVNLNPGQGILHIANAGHPDPILYSVRSGKCDPLPLFGDLLHDPFELDAEASVYDEYAAEITPGDILVLLTDGLIEAHRLDGNQYGHRFTKIIEDNAGRASKAIGEAILDDWRVHPRDEDYADDVTIVVITVNAFDRQNTSKRS
jgi:serine phosphatase RsbU (regulator of sigma subunit)